VYMFLRKLQHAPLHSLRSDKALTRRQLRQKRHFQVPAFDATLLVLSRAWYNTDLRSVLSLARDYRSEPLTFRHPKRKTRYARPIPITAVRMTRTLAPKSVRVSVTRACVADAVIFNLTYTSDNPTPPFVLLSTGRLSVILFHSLPKNATR